jgi:hypothetical protein
MRAWSLGLLLLAGCSGNLVTASPSGTDEGGSASPEASTEASAPTDAAPEACVLWVDDAGVTHGCNQGGHGPGDHDDGGDASAPPPPDASLDATDLGFGQSCWDNAQCTSDMCFDYAVKGQFCTQTCDANADCPEASLGCNGMGVCRVGN